MHGWFCDNPIGVQALQWREVPTPDPKAGEVRIKIRAASLNFPDLLTVQNKYQVKPPLPFVPGSEFSGVIDAVGVDVSHFEVGMPVACLGSSGGFATHACVPASQVITLPPGMDLVDASAFAFTYGTSYHALLDRGALKAGETVLVLGAAGGVGSAAVQIAKAAGAKVIAAASSESKASWCQAHLGADIGIAYGTDSSGESTFREAIKTATGGAGPDVVYDPVGGWLAEPVFRSMAWRGRYLVVGFAGGPIPALPLNLALLKGAAIVGVFWGSHVRRDPKAFSADMRQLAAWYAQGKVKPLIDLRLNIKDLHQAYEAMGNRAVRGKVVMVVSA
jgi:NADPH:quinone reductase